MLSGSSCTTKARGCQNSLNIRWRHTQPRLQVARAFSPPTVTDTKNAFRKIYDKPIPAMYETVIQELLVQQHFMRYNIKYKYDPVFALGIVSVFDQILDEIEGGQKESIFAAYIECLGETPATYRKDADALTELAEAASSPEDLVPSSEGSKLQQQLAQIAARVEAGEFFYTRFFAIGIFRLLELTESRDPKALEGLIKGLGVSADSVNKDLLLYKSILSKMSAAKELMKEFMEREQRKQKERDEAKSKKAEDSASKSEGSDSADSTKDTSAEKAEASA